MPNEMPVHRAPPRSLRGHFIIEEETRNLDPISGEPGAHPLGTGVGAGGGALVGAAIGIVGGPIGVAACAALGAVAGGAAGKAVARAVNPGGEDTYWRASYVSAPYYLPERTYDDYGPAFRLGYDGWSRYGGTFAESEERLAREWDSIKDESRLSWNEARHAARAAWERVDRPVPVGSERW